MKAQHLLAFVWLRWRLRANQFKRAGILNAIIFAILLVGGVILAAGLFFVALFVGIANLPKAEPMTLLYVWDGFLVAFLFFSVISLVTDLQRSEGVSLNKLMHLPVSLSGAFFMNYLSSLVNLSLILFLPPMIGLCLAQVIVKGPILLLALPLLAVFVLMVTALIYQFQGWLAALMVNKRRRRTILVVMSMLIILLAQLPNLFNAFYSWNKSNSDRVNSYWENQDRLQKDLSSGAIGVEEFERKINQLQKEEQAEANLARRARMNQLEQTARLINAVVPLGWLPLGTMGLVEGHAYYALLGMLGMTLIGSASLWRAYHTTKRIYSGAYSGRTSKRVAPKVRPSAGEAGALLVEMSVPGVSEQTSVITLGGLRSLLRAPEAKMMLLSPAILLLVFSGTLFRKSIDIAEPARMLMAFGAMSMILLTLTQVACNQFGFDRNGFRVFVLCPASRRDILVGKNLALAPWALGLGFLAVFLIQAFYPMRFDHFWSLFPQLVSMYFLYALLANCLSILAPIHISAGSLRPTNLRLIPALLHLIFVFVIPMVLGPTLLPLGFEQLLIWYGWIDRAPVALALSLVECAGVLGIYRLLVGLQGDWLQAREQAILEIVSTKAE